MAIITDYGSLKDAVAGYLSRADLTAMIPNFIQNAEARIYRDLRVRQMLSGHTLAFTANNGTAAYADLSGTGIPVEIDSFTIEGGGTTTIVERATPQSMRTEFSSGSTGRPKLFRTSSTNFIVAPIPDAAYTAHIDSYDRAESMTDNSDAPWVITDAPDLILAAAMADGSTLAKDMQGFQLWEARYMGLKNDMNKTAKNERASGSKYRGRSR